MKNIRNITAIALLAASLAACGGSSSEQKTLGGSTDTMNSVGGSNSTGAVDPGTTSDTSNNGNHMRNDSSYSNGNPNPNGRTKQ